MRIVIIYFFRLKSRVFQRTKQLKTAYCSRFQRPCQVPARPLKGAGARLDNHSAVSVVKPPAPSGNQQLARLSATFIFQRTARYEKSIVTSRHTSYIFVFTMSTDVFHPAPFRQPAGAKLRHCPIFQRTSSLPVKRCNEQEIYYTLFPAYVNRKEKRLCLLCDLEVSAV